MYGEIRNGPLPGPRGVKEENQHRGRFCKTALRTPFQRPKNM